VPPPLRQIDGQAEVPCEGLWHTVFDNLRMEALILDAAPFLTCVVLAGSALVLFGSVIFGIRSIRNITLKHGKHLFHHNPALRLIMHFLRAAIFSIVALAFMASASAVESAGLCTSEKCYSANDCGKACECVGGVPGVVSSLLLLARSELTCSHFTEAWILQLNSMVKEFRLKWNEDLGNSRR